MFPISRQNPQRSSHAARTQLVRGPTAEPVTPDNYISYQRIKTADIAADVIVDKLTSARERVELFTGRACVNQVWDLVYDLPPGLGVVSTISRLRLFDNYAGIPVLIPKPPCISIIGVYVTDDVGTDFTVPASFYWKSRVKDPARIVLRDEYDWPDTGTRTFETFRVRFSAGYLTPFTATASSANLSAADHGLSVGDLIRLTNRDGALPAPLQNLSDYYVKLVVDENTLQISATASGAAIVLTDVGVGVQFIGTLPSQMRRSILMTAAEDHYGSKGGAAARLPAGESLPMDAERILQPMRNLRI